MKFTIKLYICNTYYIDKFLSLFYYKIDKKVYNFDNYIWIRRIANGTYFSTKID